MQGIDGNRQAGFAGERTGGVKTRRTIAAQIPAAVVWPRENRFDPCSAPVCLSVFDIAGGLTSWKKEYSQKSNKRRGNKRDNKPQKKAAILILRALADEVAKAEPDDCAEKAAQYSHTHSVALRASKEQDRVRPQCGCSLR